MDPMHEHQDRVIVNGEPTGAWTQASSDSAVLLSAQNVTGLVVKDFTVSNVQRLALLTGGGAKIPHINNLIVYTGEGIGVGQVQAAYDQKLIYIDADPRSSGYGDILQGNTSPTSSMPTSGYYFAGQTVRNSNLSSTLNGGRYTALVRLTTGNTHVLNVDWGVIPFTVS